MTYNFNSLLVTSLPGSTKQPLRVFLCHASPDKPKVLELYKRLCTEEWIDPWLDTEKLLPGDDWEFRIWQALTDADLIIVFISKNSNEREGFVQREIHEALNLGLEKPPNTIFLIPLRLEDCDIPLVLQRKQYIDYFGEKKDPSYSKLLNSLMMRREQVRRKESERKLSTEQLERNLETNLNYLSGDKERKIFLWMQEFRNLLFLSLVICFFFLGTLILYSGYNFNNQSANNQAYILWQNYEIKRWLEIQKPSHHDKYQITRLEIIGDNPNEYKVLVLDIKCKCVDLLCCTSDQVFSNTIEAIYLGQYMLSEVPDTVDTLTIAYFQDQDKQPTLISISWNNVKSFLHGEITASELDYHVVYEP